MAHKCSRYQQACTTPSRGQEGDNQPGSRPQPGSQEGAPGPPARTRRQGSSTVQPEHPAKAGQAHGITVQYNNDGQGLWDGPPAD
ncbi:hypothetical protein NDU88_004562 [Pleurodeles waltl]|uniref:Uncharacterized protein n=1 Tax=Pleurodeles waltl TaxID=8319 RepID=A0AAV7V3T2_PLEWA|nr:hypothetical protein NDU88_004562 [Pleurodeles waltl]